MPTRPYDDAVGPLKPAQTPELERFGQAVTADIEADYARTFGIGDAVASQRAALQLSQTELANLSGVTQAEISRLEAGKGNQTLQTVGKILGALNLTLEVVQAGSVPSQRESSSESATSA